MRNDSDRRALQSAAAAWLSLHLHAQEERGRHAFRRDNRHNLAYFQAATGAEHAFQVVLERDYENMDCFKCDAPTVHNRRDDFRLWPCSATADDSSLIRVKDQRNPLPILIVLIASRLAHRRNDEPPSPFR